MLKFSNNSLDFYRKSSIYVFKRFFFYIFTVEEFAINIASLFYACLTLYIPNFKHYNS